MRLRPIALLVPLLGIALALISPFERPEIPVKRKKGRAPARSGLWSDARMLAEHVDVACEIVKNATGSAFVKRPTVRIATVDEVAAVIQSDLGLALRTLGAVDANEVASMSRGMADQVVAQYDPAANAVLLLPENAARTAKDLEDPSLTSTEVLRLLLVRMAVIALDRQLFPEWKEALDTAPSAGAVHAAGAVLEGHAQYVTERVALHWELPAAFASLVTLLTAPPPAGATPSPAAAAIGKEAHFALVDGHAFMKAVAKKRGRGGIMAMLKKPPTERKAIEAPSSVLTRKPPPKATDAQRALKEFAPLIGADWTRSEPTVDKDAAQALLAPVKPRDVATVMAGFVGGVGDVSTQPDGLPGCEVRLFEFRKAGLAEAYVGIARGAAKQRGATVEEGAGRDGGLPGFVAVLAVDPIGETPAHDVSLQVIHEGRFVLALVVDPGTNDREQCDDAMEAAGEVLRVAQKGQNRRREARGR